MRGVNLVCLGQHLKMKGESHASCAATSVESPRAKLDFVVCAPFRMESWYTWQGHQPQDYYTGTAILYQPIASPTGSVKDPDIPGATTWLCFIEAAQLTASSAKTGTIAKQNRGETP
jgi:hypothetical protein